MLYSVKEKAQGTFNLIRTAFQGLQPCPYRMSFLAFHSLDDALHVPDPSYLHATGTVWWHNTHG